MPCWVKYEKYGIKGICVAMISEKIKKLSHHKPTVADTCVFLNKFCHFQTSVPPSSHIGNF